MHTAPDGVLDLGVPRSEVVGWAALAGAATAGGVAGLALGIESLPGVCLVVLVLVVGAVGPALLGRAVAHPEGHLVVRSWLGRTQYEMEDIDSVVTAPALTTGNGGPPLGLVVGAELVLTSGADVPLPSTRVVPLPFLRRRLDRQVAALQAWLEEGPAGDFPAPNLRG